MATYACTIGGTTRTLQQGWTIRETANGRSIFNGAVYSADASVRPAIGSELLITEDGVRIYGGNLDTPSEAGAGGFGKIPIVTRISAVDFNALADRQHVISGGFLAGTTLISALTDIIGYLTSYGVTLDAAQVTGPTLPLLQYDVRSITSILDELSVVTNYLWRIDYDKKLRMWLPGALTAPVSITTANRFAEGDVTVEPSRRDYANRIIIQAGTGTSEVTIGWVADGVATVFPLTYKLSTHRGYVTNQGVNETLGTGATWTYQSNTYPTLDTITRTTAPANLNTISITYIAQFPYVTQSNDAGEQAANGIWEKVIVYPDVFDSTLAQNLASGQLLRSLVTSKTVKYTTRQLGIKPGQTQTITVAERNISGTHLITDVQTTSLPTKIPTVQRTVTAVGGTQYPGSWRDAFKSSFGTSSGTTVGGTILITEGGGGSAGSGTTGTLAKWTAATTLGDSAFTESGGAFTSGATGAGFTIALSTSTVTGNLAYARLPTGSGTWTASPTIAGDMTVEDTFTTELIVSPGGGLGTYWPGLMALSAGAGAVTPTNLTLQPTGDLITDPAGKDILPTLGYDINIGMLSKKYLAAHIAELWVETLVAADVMATIGGRVVVAPTTMLVRDASPTESILYVKHNQISANDVILMESGGKVEFIRFDTSNGASVDGFSYNVSRDRDGTGANQWYAGDALLNTGVTGNGFIDLYSVRGIRAASEIGPTIVGNVRQSATYNDWAPRWAIGNLNGLYGYSATTYGAAFGNPTTANVTVDATNGFRVRYGTVNRLVADIAGNLSLVGDLIVGTGGAIRSGATAYLTGTGYWLDYNAGNPRMRVGNPVGDRITWDGDLEVVSASVLINLNGIVVAAGASLLDLNSYRFSSTFGTSSKFGTYAADVTASSRTMEVWNSAGTTGKTVTTSINAESPTKLSSVTCAATDAAATINIAATEGVTLGSFLSLDEIVATPASPPSGDNWNVYAKADKLILQFNNGGTVRYYYLDGTVASGAWTHTTSAP